MPNPITQETSGSNPVEPNAEESIAQSITNIMFPEDTNNISDVETDETSENDIAETLDDTSPEPEEEVVNEEAEENPEDDSPSEEEENDNEDDVLAKFSPAQQKAFNKAIGKVKQKFKDAQAQLESVNSEKSELQSQFDSLQSQYNDLQNNNALPPEDPNNPLLGKINSIEDLNRFSRRQFDLKSQIIKNFNEEGESSFVFNGENFSVTAAEAKNILADVERSISLDIPAHRDFLKNDDKANGWLSNLPEFSKKHSELNNAITATLVKIPALKTIKGSKLAALHLAMGERLVAKFGTDAWNVATSGKIPTPVKAKLNRVPPKPITKKEVPSTPVNNINSNAFTSTPTTQDMERLIASSV